MIVLYFMGGVYGVGLMCCCVCKVCLLWCVVCVVFALVCFVLFAV